MIMRVLAALFCLPSSYLLCLGNAAFALPRPDAAGCFLYMSLGGCVHKPVVPEPKHSSGCIFMHHH